LRAFEVPCESEKNKLSDSHSRGEGNNICFSPLLVVLSPLLSSSSSHTCDSINIMEQGDRLKTRNRGLVTVQSVNALGIHNIICSTVSVPKKQGYLTTM